MATSLLAHLPAWSFVDPLLVLNEFEDDDDSDDDSLEEMLDKTEKEHERNASNETVAEPTAAEPAAAEPTAAEPAASGETVK